MRPGAALASAGRRGVVGRLLGWSLGGLNATGTLAIVLLMLLIAADVLGRALLNRPISGVPEMVSLSIVGIVFLQLAHTLRVWRLTRSDALARALQRRRPRAGHLLDGLYALIGAAMMAVLFLSSLPLFVEAWQDGDFVGSIGDFTAPTWPVKLVILIGAAATGLQLVADALTALRRAAGLPGGGAP